MSQTAKCRECGTYMIAAPSGSGLMCPNGHGGIVGRSHEDIREALRANRTDRKKSNRRSELDEVFRKVPTIEPYDVFVLRHRGRGASKVVRLRYKRANGSTHLGVTLYRAAHAVPVEREESTGAYCLPAVGRGQALGLATDKNGRRSLVLLSQVGALTENKHDG